MKIRILMLTLLLSISRLSFAQYSTIESCYNEKLPRVDYIPDTELYVIIDQTTLFSEELKQSIAENIRPFIKPNNSFSVIKFSAFIQGHYTDVLTSVELDPLLEIRVRNSISKPILAKYDNCMAQQPNIAARIIGGAMRKAFGGSSSNIDKSDILASLKDISSKVSISKAKNRILLIASDMLENSSITSFYSKQTIRQINPKIELKLVTDNQLFGDFAGARVYVIGAGLLVEDSKKQKGVYRSPQVMKTLSSFWEDWFKNSNANLIEFGQPALLEMVH